MDIGSIGILGTLLGGLLGGLLTYWNSRALAKRERSWQIVRIRQEKLEEIATILDEIQQHYLKLTGDVLLKVEKGTPLPTSGTRIPFERLRILIEFYAPAMLEDWPNLEKGQDIFAEVLIDALSDMTRSKSEKQKLNGRAFSAERHISNVCRSLSAKAAKLANEAIEMQAANKWL